MAHGSKDHISPKPSDTITQDPNFKYNQKYVDLYKDTSDSEGYVPNFDVPPKPQRLPTPPRAKGRGARNFSQNAKNGENSDMELEQNPTGSLTLNHENLETIINNISNKVLLKVDTKLAKFLEDLNLTDHSSKSGQNKEKIKNSNKYENIIITRDNLQKLTTEQILGEEELPELHFHKGATLAKKQSDINLLPKSAQDKITEIKDNSDNLINADVLVLQDQASRRAINPDAKETWDSYRTTITQRLTSGVKAKYFWSLAEHQVFPEWTVTYTPSADIIVNQSAFDKVVEMRKNIALGVLNTQAQLYTIKADHARVEANSLRDKLTRIYQQSSDSSYSLEDALNQANEAAEKVRASTYRQYLIKYQTLAQSSENYLTKGLRRGNTQQQLFPAPPRRSRARQGGFRHQRPQFKPRYQQGYQQNSGTVKGPRTSKYAKNQAFARAVATELANMNINKVHRM